MSGFGPTMGERIIAEAIRRERRARIIRAALFALVVLTLSVGLAVLSITLWGMLR